MKVTIWDLDYYYATEKRDIFNPDVMKISSYHKQKGDQVNFVQKQDDIYRPYDIYYIIKENNETPNPPFDFYTNNRVRWWGNAVKFRINWKMDNVMLGVRPDYLLYPEKETKMERAEQIRLLGNEGKLLPVTQDWHNSFKNKQVLVTDDKLWTTDTDTTIKALKRLEGISNLIFLEPIWLQKLISNKDIMNQFLKLKLTHGAIQFVPIFIEDYAEHAAAWLQIKENFPRIKIGELVIRFRPTEHWESKEKALQEWFQLQDIIINSKKNKISVRLKELKHRTDTPYFLLFETVSDWLREKPQWSWLEWITSIYGPGLKFNANLDYWGHPERWNEVFRDLLRQTWRNAEFLTAQWGEKFISHNDIPWIRWQKEFIYEI